MKPSTTKETPKGKTPSKGSKISKSASTQEAVEEPIVEVVMDEAGEDVPHGDDQTQDISDPKTRKSLNPDWFKQPPRLSTPDPKWKKRQIENLIQDILLGPAFNQLKGTCSSSIELELNFHECFNALTDKLDWNNSQGDRYSFDLSKSLPLQGPLGHRTIAAEYLFNNDLKYLKTSDLEGHLEEIVVKRSDQQLYKFKEGDFVDLHLNDIEDMLLLLVQHKLFHLEGSDILGVKSYQKKLNITSPQKTYPDIKCKEPYTPSYYPPGIVYEDLNKKKSNSTQLLSGLQQGDTNKKVDSCRSKEVGSDDRVDR
nr:hypothetical protein [Tanacetum cinerariifolium]